MKTIKELDEQCRLRNKSIVINKRHQVVGYRGMDYPVNAMPWYMVFKGSWLWGDAA